VTGTDSKGAKGYATAMVVVSALGGSTSMVTLNVNGHPYTLAVPSNRTLQDVLHDQMGFTSVKSMCTGQGACGSCAVIVDGRAILSCMALAVALDASAGHTIQTAEGIAASGHPITQSWADMDAMQCGYCSPGAVVSAKALLDSNPTPTSDQVMQALAGNICVCGTYQYWPNAVLDAAKKLKGGS
jgi:aerobic-type carbon monoxide dehydrogenase small subunit (CoxS/CutS family)